MIRIPIQNDEGDSKWRNSVAIFNHPVRFLAFVTDEDREEKEKRELLLLNLLSKFESNLAGTKILCENYLNLIRGKDTPHLYRSPKKRGGIIARWPAVRQCGDLP